MLTLLENNTRLSSIHFELGRTRIHLNVERWRVPETWFSPSMAGVDSAGLGEVLQTTLARFTEAEKGRLVKVHAKYPCGLIVLLTALCCRTYLSQAHLLKYLDSYRVSKRLFDRSFLLKCPSTSFALPIQPWMPGGGWQTLRRRTSSRKLVSPRLSTRNGVGKGSRDGGVGIGMHQSPSEMLSTANFCLLYHHCCI